MDLGQTRVRIHYGATPRKGVSVPPGRELRREAVIQKVRESVGEEIGADAMERQCQLAALTDAALVQEGDGTEE